MSNYTKRINKRNREIAEYVDEMAKCYGAQFLASIPEENAEVLKSFDHPKLPDSDLSLYDYISWMCGQGWHKKAKSLYSEYFDLTEVASA